MPAPLVVTLATLAALATPPHPLPPVTARVVFANAAVIPMDRERVLAGQDVVVEAGRIRALSPHRVRSWPAGTTLVNATGKYVIPGLSDLHVHTQFGDERQLELYVRNGVTTVLNLSGTPELLDWKRRIAAGTLAGPAFYTAGPILDGDPPTNPTHTVVHDRAEAERAVDAQAAAGYDFIKPYSALSDSAYFGIVDAARRDHMRLVGHVSWNVGVERTVLAGQDAIAHVEELYRYFVDRHQKPPPDTRPDSTRIPALAELLKQHGTWVVTTLSADTDILAQATALDSVLRSPDMAFVPASYLAECRTGDPYAKRGADWIEQNRIMLPFLSQIAAGLRAAHVPMLAGTDATNPIQVPGVSLHEELAELCAAGLTPYEALVTSTRNAAEFLRRADTRGTVAAGARADLVLLDANPLIDIRNTRRIDGVMVAGRWYDAAALAAMDSSLKAHFAAE